MLGKIIIITGPCGSGKSTIANQLAKSSEHPLTIHLHTDDFYNYIRNGYIEPWKEESASQNEVVIRAIVAYATVFYKQGYEVYVDGIIGPWFLDAWLEIVKEEIEVNYIVLRPNLETTITRVVGREKNKKHPLSSELIKSMWNSFASLGKYENNVVDNSNQTIEESASDIKLKLKTNSFLLQ